MATHINDPFGLVATTEALRLIPQTYGRIRNSGIFRDEPVAYTTVRIVREFDTLSVVPLASRGSGGAALKRPTRDAIFLDIGHLPLVSKVEADAVRERLGWGTNVSDMADAIAPAVAQELQAHRNAHAITHELWLAHALKGKLLDADGTEIYDFFSVFSVTQNTKALALSASTTKMRTECVSIARMIEDALGADIATGSALWCSRSFFDAFIEHSQVKAAYSGYAEASQKIGGDLRTGFVFGGLTISEYHAIINGSTLIPEGEAIAFPLGTQNTFSTYWGPSNLQSMQNIGAVGTVGPFALQTLDEKGRFVEVNSEMNILPLCKRPGCLVKVTMT